VIQIRVPPLRERVEDLPAICEAVLERIARDAGVWPPPTLSRDALLQLQHYSFPGNVRELENLLHRAVALSGGEVIERADLGLPDDAFGDADLVTERELPVADLPVVPEPAPAPPGMPAAPSPPPLPKDLVAYLDEVERDILVRALERYRFNRTAAGASLGLSLRQMRYRMARLGINVADHVGERFGE
jgi:two-component system response regulator PilR (NtrC family)